MEGKAPSNVIGGEMNGNISAGTNWVLYREDNEYANTVGDEPTSMWYYWNGQLAALNTMWRLLKSESREKPGPSA